MRKIKFRGKRLDNGEWVYGDLLRRSGDTYIVYEDKSKDHNLRNIVIDSDNNPSYPPVTDWTIYELVDPETVGQYTGMKDKNGKEIYEGDILHSKGIDWLVGYEEDTAQYWGRRTNGQGFELWKLIDKEWEEGLHLIYILRFYSVIGNKYDNPELLEENND